MTSLPIASDAEPQRLDTRELGREQLLMLLWNQRDALVGADQRARCEAAAAEDLRMELGSVKAHLSTLQTQLAALSEALRNAEHTSHVDKVECVRLNALLATAQQSSLEHQERVAQLNALLAASQQDNVMLQASVANHQGVIDVVHQSLTWRVGAAATAPMRAAARAWRRRRTQ